MLKKIVKKIIPKKIISLIKEYFNGKAIPVFVDYFLINSFAQYQEDLIIDSYFNNKSNGNYVDIGAYDPNEISNTKKFYLKGWSGINIDPNFSTIESFKKERSNDINLNIGISFVEKKEIFYEMNYKSLSTFSEKDAIETTLTYKDSKIIKKYEVECKKLSSVLREYNKNIDFLSIDVEGYELQVLNSNDWDSYRPELIIIEINRNTAEIFSYMKSIEYNLIYNNHTNGIFVDKKSKIKL